MILDINPAIIFPFVDRLLGGGREQRPNIPNRPLTDIEIRLVSRITELVLRGLENAWSNMCHLGLKVRQVESNPQLIQIVPPNEVIVLISFEISMGELRGMMNLCIPFNTIEPLAGKLSSDTWSSYSKKTTDPRQAVNLETGLAQAARGNGRGTRAHHDFRRGSDGIGRGRRDSHGNGAGAGPQNLDRRGTNVRRLSGGLQILIKPSASRDVCSVQRIPSRKF